MKLLETYAHQVAAYHPSSVRDELFAEIYDEICEEFADARRRDPALTEAGFLDANKQHPMKYAARLASDDSACLIGPRFYFSFLATLKAAASITSACFFAIAVVFAVTSENSLRTFFHVLFGLPQALLWVSAAILGIFVAMEKSGDEASWLDDWTAADLKQADGHQGISKSQCFFDLSVSIIALLWIFDVIRLPMGAEFEGVAFVDWQVLLPEAFWLILTVLFLVDAGLAILRLTRNLWTRRLRLAIIGLNAAWLVMGFYVLIQPQLLDVPPSAPQHIAGLVSMANQGLKGFVAVIMAIVAWDIFTHARILLRKG